jgi:hypothetical protein
MSDTATQAPQPRGDSLDTDEVEARLAWLASARSEDEALLIESVLVVQTDNRTHEGDPEEQPQQ